MSGKKNDLSVPPDEVIRQEFIFHGNKYGEDK